MEEFHRFLSEIPFTSIIKLIIIFAVGYFSARLLAKIVEKASQKHITRHSAALTRKVTYYLVIVCTILVALSTIGIQLGGLLAAAGLLTVALGFAAQTSVSNIISGVFLLMERPFEVDDIIDVGGTVGTVLSMDLLSTKLRTFDNLFVRIPNETLLKSTVKTVSKYKIRRIDIKFNVAYKESISKAKEAVKSFLESSPLVLEDPAPMIITKGLGDSGVDLEAKVWIDRGKIFKAKDEVTVGIKNALDKAGIEIPFPHLTLFYGDPSQLAALHSRSHPPKKIGIKVGKTALDRASINIRPKKRVLDKTNAP